MASPIRSLTLLPGFRVSILASTGAGQCRATLLSRTSGVRPTVSRIVSKYWTPSRAVVKGGKAPGRLSRGGPFPEGPARLRSGTGGALQARGRRVGWGSEESQGPPPAVGHRTQVPPPSCGRRPPATADASPGFLRRSAARTLAAAAPRPQAAPRHRPSSGRP